MRGKDYLEVKYRIVWFREEKPDWGIETELVDIQADSCLAKATIRNEAGRIMAQSHKFEDKAGFPDFKEKCETGAIGRALALLGYGTQFTDDLDEGKRIVDSPVSRPQISPTGKVVGSVGPSQPEPGDGFQDDSYAIPFGKYRSRRLEDVGPRDLASYVTYLEDTAKKKGEEIKGQVADFIQRAVEYIVACETGPSE